MWLASRPPAPWVISRPSGCAWISACSTSLRGSSKWAGMYMAWACSAVPPPRRRALEGELVDGRVQPSAELEPDLGEGAGVDEAQPLVQADAGSVGGVDAAHHH